MNRTGRSRGMRAVAVLCGCILGAAETHCCADGKELFLKHCAPCHGPDGKARTPIGRKIGVKDLSESKAADADVVRQILEGTKDKRGLERMPAFKGKLAAEEVESLVPVAKSFRK